MQMPNSDQVLAFGRHVVTFSMGAVTAGAALHIINGADQTSATNAITQISSGVASIVAGVSTLVAIASGVWSAFTASPLWQMLSVAKNPAVTKIVAPSIADEVPSAKVVPK
jgi:hypothetical protein